MFTDMEQRKAIYISILVHHSQLNLQCKRGQIAIHKQRKQRMLYHVCNSGVQKVG